MGTAPSHVHHQGRIESVSLVNLPGSPSARRKEVAIRLAAVEAKLDTCIKGAAKAAPTPPPAEDPRVKALARAMGHRDYYFPTGARPHLTFDEDGEPIATGITLCGRFWSVRDIIFLDFIKGRVWDWNRFNAVNAALGPVTTPGEWIRPHSAAARPGRY